MRHGGKRGRPSSLPIAPFSTLMLRCKRAMRRRARHERLTPPPLPLGAHPPPPHPPSPPLPPQYSAAEVKAGEEKARRQAIDAGQLEADAAGRQAGVQQLEGSVAARREKVEVGEWDGSGGGRGRGRGKALPLRSHLQPGAVFPPPLPWSWPLHSPPELFGALRGAPALRDPPPPPPPHTGWLFAAFPKRPPSSPPRR